MNSAKPQNNFGNMTPYSQNLGPQMFGANQQQNMPYNNMGMNTGNYFGNQRYDMQMPWMNQFQNQNQNQFQNQNMNQNQNMFQNMNQNQNQNMQQSQPSTNPYVKQMTPAQAAEQAMHDKFRYSPQNAQYNPIPQSIYGDDFGYMNQPRS
jgi:hypothetical protein